MADLSMSELVGSALAAAVGASAALAGAWKLFGGYILDRRLTKLKDDLARAERQRTVRLAERYAAYGGIWELTGAFNLFGPERRPNLEGLTREMRDWYFTHGQMMTREVRQYYFLMQEAVTFCAMSGVMPARPGGESLYGMPVDDRLRTVAKLSGLLKQALKVDASGQFPAPSVPSAKEVEAAEKNTQTYCAKLEEYLPAMIDYWKATIAKPLFEGGSESGDVLLSAENRAWLVLQHLTSRFRTFLTVEIASRDPDV